MQSNALSIDYKPKYQLALKSIEDGLHPASLNIQPIFNSLHKINIFIS